ncbi:Sodium-dependent glucose transporter 1 [Amphibalanus amphitrite]|uniref:Sodium-dependent glucose transporter 1 n=1 Tax=Amphibalanus amphitrite TaxID=1232801 RepID=A0A6A4W2B5_AMPAM|nr:Sodium-dependent glucose transporter 1 [Amphibalanus amphitrite]
MDHISALIWELSNLTTRDRLCQRDRGTPITVTLATRLNSIEGSVRSDALTEVPNRELLEELQSQGVVRVQRLRSRDLQKLGPNPTIRLTFSGRTLPQAIRCGYLSVPVDPWVPAPRPCTKCWAYGHSKRACRRRQPMCGRCGGPHDAEKCSGPEQCPGCGGPHPAWDRRCPIAEDAKQWHRAEVKNRRAEHRAQGHGRPNGATWFREERPDGLLPAPHPPSDTGPEETAMSGLPLPDPAAEEDDDGLQDRAALLTPARPRPGRRRPRPRPHTAAGRCLPLVKTFTICLSFFTLGLCIALPGPTLLDLQSQVSVSMAQISQLFFWRALGYLAGSMISGLLFDKLNRPPDDAGEHGASRCRDGYRTVAAQRPLAERLLRRAGSATLDLLIRMPAPVRRAVTLVHWSHSWLSCCVSMWAWKVAMGQLLMSFSVHSKVHLSRAGGAYVTSVFWGLFATGRALSVCIAGVLRPAAVLAVNYALVTAGSAVLLAAGSWDRTALLVGGALAGLGMSSVYPAALVWLEQHVHVSSRLAAVLVVAGALGEMLLPAGVGALMAVEPRALTYSLAACTAVCLGYQLAAQEEEEDMVDLAKYPGSGEDGSRRLLRM